MAATGLLGINPYYKGVAMDFSSKPTQLAIQLQQKERAKAEAYEKYFMDYEKSLNPAGLAQGESKEFLNKYNKIKENWIKNKQAILNPAKYGYDAQSQYFADLKDAQMYIEQGKQASAERKAYNTYLDQARKAGKYIDGDLEVTANAMKTVGLGYEAPDTSRVQIYDPYDDRKFMQNVWGTAELPTKVINRNIGGGKVIPETYHLKIPEMVTLAPERLKDAEMGTRGYVRNNKGAVKYFKTLMADDALLAEANKVYKEYKGQGAKINDEEDFAVAYGLIKKPGGFVKAGKEEETKAYTRAQQDAYIRGRKGDKGEIEEYSPEEHVSAIFRDADDSIKSLTVEGKNIEGVRVQLPEEVASKYERKIGNTKFSPDFFYMTNDKKDIYPIYLDPQGKKTKSGANILDVKLSERIPVETNLIPTMGKVFGGQTYTRKNLYTTGDGKSSVPRVGGTKGSAGIDWKKNK